MCRLGDIPFDPTLHHGYKKRQELEPGLKDIQQAITRANHLVFVYPTWWGTMPGHNQIKRTILEFCGIKPVTITSIGPARFASPAKREAWLKKVVQYAMS